MAEYSLTEARAALPQLLNRAAEGEVITITRHGAAAVVLVSHDRWVKTRTHDVLVEARKLREQLNAARFEDFKGNPAWDADAHIAEIRRDRDRDPWDDLEPRV